MHRVERDDLVTLLVVALRTAPAHIKQGLRSKQAMDSDKASGALAELLAKRFDNKSYMVIAADMVPAHPSGERIGIFGLDEPDPFEPVLAIIPPLTIDGKIVTLIGDAKP